MIGENSKVILITGASSGIGKSIATYLSSLGHIVYGTSRNPEKYALHSTFTLVPLDVMNDVTIRDCVSQIMSRHQKIDVLINNAGIGMMGPIEESTDAEIRKAFEVNFLGPLRVIRAILPHMRSHRQGLIINVTSMAGYMGLPFRGIYSATKAALEVTTEAYRMEIKPFGVEMVNVAPGDFATDVASRRIYVQLAETSPYSKIYTETLAMMDEHVDEGSDPILMAKAVARIINSSNPKIHYKVATFMQRFSIVLKRILPDKMFEKLLLHHYKL